MTNKLEQERENVRQLKKQAAVERIPVSEAIKDLVNYCDENQKNDPFVVGFNSVKTNPFYNKSSCVLL